MSREDETRETVVDWAVELHARRQAEPHAHFDDDLMVAEERLHAAVGEYVGAGFRTEPIRRLLIEATAHAGMLDPLDIDNGVWDEKIKAAMIEAAAR
jgi:acetyl-CoA acetyltransferase